MHKFLFFFKFEYNFTFNFKKIDPLNGPSVGLQIIKENQISNRPTFNGPRRVHLA